MLQKILCFLLVVALTSCGAGKRKSPSAIPPTHTVAKAPGPPLQKTSKRALRKAAKAQTTAIIATALSFLGTPYRYGGATHKGMDCSGLVHTTLKKNGIPFPRVSYQMAREGERIRAKRVQKGDLLYFRTGRPQKRINHVGLVVAVQRKEIKFIHATSSQGVQVSSLQERYWKRAFVKAMRVL